MSNVSTELPENVSSWNELFDIVSSRIDKYQRMEDLHFLPEFVEWEVFAPFKARLIFNSTAPAERKIVKYELRYIELMTLKEAKAKAIDFTFDELCVLRDCLRSFGFPGDNATWDTTATKINTLFENKRKERRERARKNLPLSE